MRGTPVGSLRMQMHLERLGCLYLHEAAAVAACALEGGTYPIAWERRARHRLPIGFLAHTQLKPQLHFSFIPLGYLLASRYPSTSRMDVETTLQPARWERMRMRRRQAAHMHAQWCRDTLWVFLHPCAAAAAACALEIGRHASIKQ